LIFVGWIILLSPGRQQPEPTLDYMGYIAQLTRENQILQEKLSAANSKHNTAPPVPPPQPGPLLYHENGREAFNRSLGYTPMNSEQPAFPSWPYSAQFSHGTLEAIRREERLSAAYYQSQQQLQHFHILYGYPHGGK